MAPIVGSNDIIYYVFLKIKKYYFIFSKCFIFNRWKRYKYKNIYFDKIENSNLFILNYLSLLVSISLRFTQSWSIEDEKYELKEEFYGVNAPSCEFLDFLVNIISDRDLLIIIAD